MNHAKLIESENLTEPEKIFLSGITQSLGKGYLEDLLSDTQKKLSQLEEPFFSLFVFLAAKRLYIECKGSDDSFIKRKFSELKLHAKEQYQKVTSELTVHAKEQYQKATVDFLPEYKINMLKDLPKISQLIFESQLESLKEEKTLIPNRLKIFAAIGLAVTGAYFFGREYLEKFMDTAKNFVMNRIPSFFHYKL